jgi:hypothetical protein
VTLKVKDAYATCLELKAKRIFLAPVKDNAVRIALVLASERQDPRLGPGHQGVPPMTDFYFANQVFVTSVKDFEPYFLLLRRQARLSKRR